MRATVYIPVSPLVDPRSTPPIIPQITAFKEFSGLWLMYHTECSIIWYIKLYYTILYFIMVQYSVVYNIACHLTATAELEMMKLKYAIGHFSTI